MAARMGDDDRIAVQVVPSIDQISATDWDACARATRARPLDPFSTHRFLKALEDSGSVGAGTGWHPQHLVARAGDQVIAVMPNYVKTHSQGEYIFDHNWAHAYENAGGKYYPKLQSAIPFTPATGRRFLIREGFDEIGFDALSQALRQVVLQNEFSGSHVTFCTQDEATRGADRGFLQRIGQQYHWVNQDYADFDGFLADLTSRKRKNIRRERKTAQGFGGTIQMVTGDDIQPEHWDAIWQFYQDTGARKWGTPYLTRAFFECAHESLRDDILLILCERDGHWVAGAVNFIGADTLYGRYWGCSEMHACLHFEVCYYQAIDFAIANGLARVEAGAQGEHKLARGYLPCPTYSLHWFGNEGFQDAVATYLDAERKAVGEDIEIITSYGPFKTVTEEPDGTDTD